MILAAISMVAGLGLLLIGESSSAFESPLLLVLGGTLLLVGSVAFAFLVRRMRKPRVGYRVGEVIFFIDKSSRPIRVPIEIVEAFFLGQTPLDVPFPSRGAFESRNLVARLSQREPHWAKRDVSARLGHWCDGYVTIRGTHCEPLDIKLINQINQSLASAQRAIKKRA